MSRSAARALVLWMAIAGGLAGPSAAAQDATPDPPVTSKQARALELHDEAKQLYAKGKYDEALAKLNEAVKLDPKAKELHYNIGLIHEKRGDFDGALRAYRACRELEMDSAEREQLERTIKRLQGARNDSVLNPHPQPVIGSSTVIEVRQGVSNWVWVAAGAAGAAFITGAILAARASAVDPGDDAMTGGGVSLQNLQDDARSAHKLAIGADVMLVLGSVASAAALTIAIISAETNVESSTAWHIELGPTGGGMAWRF